MFSVRLWGRRSPPVRNIYARNLILHSALSYPNATSNIIMAVNPKRMPVVAR